jgi:hypothetical protein
MLRGKGAGGKWPGSINGSDANEALERGAAKSAAPLNLSLAGEASR